MNGNGITWKMYRDGSSRPMPKKLAEMAAIYKQKMGCAPNVIGLPRGVDGELIAALGERFRVMVGVVPTWAQSEIWLGVEVKDAT